MNLKTPSYIENDMKVIVPFDGASRYHQSEDATTSTGIWGVVTCAAGYHGRVKTRTFERWFHIDDMRVEL